jgi:hypothetical protein
VERHLRRELARMIVAFIAGGIALAVYMTGALNDWRWYALLVPYAVMVGGLFELVVFVPRRLRKIEREIWPDGSGPYGF